MPDNHPQTTQQEWQRERSEQVQPELNPGAIQQQIEAADTGMSRRYWKIASDTADVSDAGGKWPPRLECVPNASTVKRGGTN